MPLGTEVGLDPGDMC